MHPRFSDRRKRKTIIIDNKNHMMKHITLRKSILLSVLLLLVFIPSSSLTTTAITSSNRSNVIHPKLTGSTLAILNPENNTVVGDIVSIILSTDFNISISAFEIYINTTLVAYNTTIYQWNTTTYADGNYVILARVRDDPNQGWIETKHVVTVDSNYDSGVIKLLDYNIQETGKNPAWLDVLKEENADIVILEETGGWDGGNDPAFVSAVTSLNTYFNGTEEPYAYYNATWDNPSVTAGEAIISRYPIREFNKITYLTLDDGSIKKAHNPMLDAVVEINDMWVHVIGIHLKCCSGTLEEANREGDMEGLINYMDALGDVPIILAGDFNSFSPLDVGDLAPQPQPGNLGDGPISMLLNASNPHASTVHTWMDSYRVLNPDDPGYSYVDPYYKSRIDFFMINQYFFNAIVNSTVASTPTGKIGSDHYPVDLTLNLDHTTYDLRPPVRVTGLQASFVNATTVQLTWDASPAPDFNFYRIYKDNTLMKEQTETTWFDSDLSPKTIHTYEVSAVDINGNEGFRSHPAMVNESYGVLTVPYAPIVNATPGDHQVTLTWSIDNGGLPIIEYRIYRTIRLDLNFVFFGTSTTTSFTDTSTSNGRTYYYKVSGVNALGEGNRSETVSARPFKPLTVPSEPQDLHATVNNQTLSVYLEWNLPADLGGTSILYYVIYRGTTPGGPYQAIGNTTERFYNDTTALPGKTYYYVVTAVNAIGESTFSTEVQVTIPSNETVTTTSSTPVSTSETNKSSFTPVLAILLNLALAVLIYKRKKFR